MDATNRQDDARLLLAGIAAERARATKYLEALDQREREIRDTAMTGTTRSATPRNKNSKGSAKQGRQIDEETRKKMSEKAKLRWAKRRAAKQAKEGTPATSASQTTENRLGFGEEIPAVEAAQ